MSKKLPIISVTAEQYSKSSSSSHDSDSNDMDYGHNSGGVTDVEDFDSQAEVLKLNSRRSSGNISPRPSTKHQKSKPFENDVTDVEDYDTDSDDEDKSTVYPELKLSLREFLQQGLQNQEAVDNDTKECCEIRAGNFLQAQNLNGMADYLTDCEDYNTDSEVDHGCEKSVCVDLDNAIGDQGRVNIADSEKHEDDSDHYEDVSVISDISDLASAMSDCAGIGTNKRGMSEDEVLMVSGSNSEEVCQIACSGSESDSGGAAANSASISESSLPPIDVAFVSASGEPRRNSKSTLLNAEKRYFLQVGPKNEEVLTDIEGIDDSAAEDSFDNEEDDEQPIPRAVILAYGDDGTCLTDVEDMYCDDISLASTVPEILTVAQEKLPLPHREVVVLKEDKYGDTITNVMPMNSNYEFGIYNHLKDVSHTDSEDYSCGEELSANLSLAEELAIGGQSLIENEVIVSNELLKQQQSKRLEVLSNAESVTDVEEIFVAGTNRRKKLKTRTLSKGKNKLLDVVKGKEEGITDVEDMDLSECDLPPGVKRVEQLKQQAKGHATSKLIDNEDISTDDASDASEPSLPPSELPKHMQNKSKLQPLQLRLLNDDAISQQNTDIEDVQLPSDAEDVLEPPAIKVVNSNSQEFNDMLNESYTVVHERSGRSFNAEAEKLHIKGVIRDAHTDTEYVESDESAAKSGFTKTTIVPSILQTERISQEIGDVKVGEGDEGEDLVARIREEAKILVDNVLEESVEFIESHGEQPNGPDFIKQEYNSESENYAITCDDIGGIDVIKSPTIESMSGKSFDDNMSFTDEHIPLPLHAQNITTTTTTTTITTQFQQQQQQQQQPITSAAAPASTKAKETSGDLPVSTDTTPIPPPAVVAATTTTTTLTTAAETVVDTNTFTTTIHDTPTPKPRVLKISPPESISEGTDSTTIPNQVQQCDLPTDICIDANAPVPKPRAPIKHTDQFENLAALGEQSDSISLRSLDFTEELSKTDEPSTELSIRSQQRDVVTTTTTTTASEDHTESFEPTSEISVDDADTEKSETVEKTTSFYIGESSRNVITKTSTKSPIMSPQDEDPKIDINIEAKDICLMKEVSVDSDEANDAFKEYITMKPDDALAMANKIIRQGSETRNDLLEFENAEKDKTTDDKLSKVTTEESLTTSTGSSGRAIIEVAPSSSEDPDESSKEIPEIVNTIAEKPCKFELPLEKSEWEISEKEIPMTSQPKVVHSPQQPEVPTTKTANEDILASQTISEVHESIEVVKREFKLTKGSQDFTTEVENDDLSSFIGIPELQASTIDSTQPPDGLFDTTIRETLNKQAAMAHYAKDVFSQAEHRDDHGSLGFISTGTAEDFSSMEEHLAKEEQGSLGFISTETAEDFSSMEDYYTERLATASVVAEESMVDKSIASAFDEAISDQSIRPVDLVVHRIKTDTSPDSTNRWSIPDVDNSSSSESYHKSFEKTQSRPLSSDVENLLTGTGTSSEYQTARDFTPSTCRDGTEYVSAVSTLGSSSGKSISSHESMRSLDSQSETSANLASIDISELSETLVASSTEADALEAEEMARLRDLRADDDDSDESLDIIASSYPTAEQQTSMKRSQEMIFKPKSESETVLQSPETMQIEEYPKPKEAERTWGLAYPIEDKEGKADSPRDSEKNEDILLYHGDARRSIDEAKLASSLDEGSILSVSMSSTSNIDTVVENFDDLIGSAGSSSLTGIEGFQYAHDDPVVSTSIPEDTFILEMESKEHSPQDSNASTPPGGESKKRGHKRSESTTISEDALKNLDKDAALLGEGKESESESDTDPYESEYARQFRSPKERKNKKKKQAAAEMDHSSELEKRPFTPSQLVAEVIVEDIATEELEAEAALIEERRPSQNMQDYSNIPDIMVTEVLKSPIVEEDADTFIEKTLYKVRTEEKLNKASDVADYQKAKAEEKELDFQRRVQEQYKQKLEELKRAEVGADYDDNRAADSPDSFEMVEQPDISDEFVIIEEVAKEANEVDLGGKSIKIKPTKYEQKHDEDVEKIIIKSAPADPKLGSQLYKDDLNFEFEESPPTGASSSSEQQEESDSSDTAAANKRWVEMQLTDTQLRYPYDLTGAVLEDIKEEDGEFEVGSSRISSFKDSFSSTPEYDLAARRYHSRGDHDDVSMSSLQEFESLEQAISLENRNRGHQGSTDSSNGSFTRRYMVRHSGSGTAPGDDVSISSLKDFEGLENACIEAHLIEIKAKEEAALLSRSDESNKSNGSGNGAVGNVLLNKVTRTVTRTEVLPAGQAENLELLLKQQMERNEFESKTVGGTVKISEMPATELDPKSKIDSQDSEKDSIDSMEIRSHDMMTSSIESFDISKDATTRSDIDSLEIDKRHSRQESIESFGDEQLDLMSKLVSGGGVTLGDGLTTTTTTTTTSTDADGQEHTVTRVITTTTVSGVGGGIQELPLDESGMSKDISVDSLNLCIEQTTSSAGTTATYQTSAGNSQMSGSVTSCASSTLMEDSFPGVGGMSSSQMSASFWSHDESTVVEDEDLRTQQQEQPQQQ